MAYRVSCEEHDNFGDVPDFDAAVDWEAAHQRRYPKHTTDAEPYPMAAAFPIDPSAIKAGEF